MNRFSLALALLLCLPLAAHADEASHKAKAKELIMLLHTDHMVTGIMDNAMQQIASATAQKYDGVLPPEVKVSLGDFQKKLAAVMEPQIGWSGVEPEFVKYYTDAFSEEEIDQILAFYKSPAGKTLLDKMPTINSEAGELVQSRIATLKPQVAEMFSQFMSGLPAPKPAELGPVPAAPPAAHPSAPATAPR